MTKPVERYRRQDARELLRKNGFTEREINVIVRAAIKNKKHPVYYAQAAIRLRTHVESGLPLS